MKKICFFCGEAIEGKSHDEHIIPDKVLEIFNLKNKYLNLLHGGALTYSRLKVDSHSVCNNQFGSRYEEIVIKILKDIDSHKDQLSFMHKSQDIQIGYSDSLSSILGAWFSKIFYGIIWFEANLKKDIGEELRLGLRSFLEEKNFQMMRQSYKVGAGFCLPSSVYYVPLRCVGAIPFDFGTMIDSTIFWLKFDKHLFMSCLGDGQIVSNYLNQSVLSQILENEVSDERSLFYLCPLSHMIATRKAMPKSPLFLLSDNMIINMSLTTSAKPEALNLDMENYTYMRRDAYATLLSHLGIPEILHLTLIEAEFGS